MFINAPTVLAWCEVAERLSLLLEPDFLASAANSGRGLAGPGHTSRGLAQINNLRSKIWSQEIYVLIQFLFVIARYSKVTTQLN